MARDRVHVKVSDALADAVVDTDEHPVGFQAGFDRPSDPLRGAKQRRKKVLRQIHQRNDVLSRNDQDMALEHGSAIEEGENLGFVKHAVGRPLAGDDLTEQASIHEP
jgi:predicted alpha/beta hydrolase